MSERSLTTIGKEKIGYMLEIFREALAGNGNKAALAQMTEKEWQAVFVEACVHGVQGLFFEVAKQYVKKDSPLFDTWENTWKKACEKEQLWIREYARVQEEIADRIATEKTTAVRIGGFSETDICNRYEKPGMRCLDEFEIICPTKERKAIGAILKNCGYQMEYMEPSGDHYKKEDFEQKEIYRFVIRCNDNYTGRVKEKYENGNFGFKSIADWYVLSHCSGMSQDLFAQRMDALCTLIFGNKDVKFDENSLRVMYYIMGDGAFGRRKDYEPGKMQILGKSLSVVFGRIFPPVQELQRMYPVLKEKPLLLPYVWAYNALHLLTCMHK